MLAVRLIPRLDIKSGNLIKGIHLEGLRVVGNPVEYALRYADDADEILYMDAVASLYGRNSLLDVVDRVSQDVFVPMTVGGGIRSVEDVRQALRHGADKVAINTAAVKRPEIITEMAHIFGSQCVVLSIEAIGEECFTDNGREHTWLDVVEWAKQAVSLGAGEILLTDVDREGTGKGFNIDLLSRVSAAVPVPVVVSGGMGAVEHAVEAINAGASGVAMADILHWGKMTLPEIKQRAFGLGVKVRV